MLILEHLILVGLQPSEYPLLGLICILLLSCLSSMSLQKSDHGPEASIHPSHELS